MSEAGRPKLRPGTWGNVTITAQARVDGRWVTVEDRAAQRFRARTRVRDLDGNYRGVERFGPSKGAAKRALDSALVERTTPTKGHLLRAKMSVSEAGAAWLRQVARPEANLSPNTVSQYRANFRRYIERGAVSGLTLREVNNVPTVRNFLEGVADAHGAGAAKTARSVLSNIITLAVNDGVLDHNAVRDVRAPKPVAPIERPLGADRQEVLKGTEPEEAARDTTRAFTRAERDHLLAFAAEDGRAKARDVVDLLRFMAGVGCRLSEALAQRWEDIDLDAGTARVRGTKSAASSNRLVHLPEWLTEALRARHKRGIDRSGIVFSSPRTGGLRDRRNAQRGLRDVLDRAGYPWATPHTLRRTVATLIDEAGLPIAVAADVLGHADPSMTARVYLGRKVDTSRAAKVL